MSNSISFLESPQASQNIYTVKLHVPYLDTVFQQVPDDLIGLFLETSFSVLLARYSRWENCESVEQFIELTDDYEENIVNSCIYAAMDYELVTVGIPVTKEWLAQKGETYYYIIEQILQHYHEYIIDTLSFANEDQIEFLISIFEERRKIEIRYFSYDPMTSDLYLFIPN